MSSVSAPPLVERVPQRDHVAERLRHLLAAEGRIRCASSAVRTHARRHPIGQSRSRGAGTPGPPRRRGPPTLAQKLLGHGRALDMPAGLPRPHGESHHVSSPSLCPFQSAKSRGLSFSVVLFFLLGRIAHRVLVEPAREDAVLGVAIDAEVDVAAGRVRELELRSARRSARRSRESCPSPSARDRAGRGRVVRVVDVQLCRVRRRAARSAQARPGIDLVVDVRDVLDQRHVGSSPWCSEPALGAVSRSPKRLALPTWTRCVDGRAAEVHADRAGRRRAARRARE